MGRRWLSGPDGFDPPGRAARPGYELSQDEVQNYVDQERDERTQLEAVNNNG
jgi:hypothetical protein